MTGIKFDSYLFFYSECLFSFNNIDSERTSNYLIAAEPKE
jgi:hypothetical protein